jgi:hypothetical protein
MVNPFSFSYPQISIAMIESVDKILKGTSKKLSLRVITEEEM